MIAYPMWTLGEPFCVVCKRELGNRLADTVRTFPFHVACVAPKRRGRR